MSTFKLYRGVWPQNVNRLAKYAVRFVEGEWKVTVWYDIGSGMRTLAVEGGGANLVSRVNSVKMEQNEQPGGAFYVNEYRHVIVPVKGDQLSGAGSQYYYAGKLENDLRFSFEGKPLNTKPILPDGTPLKPGESWIGPRPGIPYVLSAGAGDIYYETPALTDTDPPQIRPMTIRKVQLSKILKDKPLLKQAIQPLVSIRGHLGGRFYVNEHGAMFSPVSTEDEINYIYCGQIDWSAWFPEPDVS